MAAGIVLTLAQPARANIPPVAKASAAPTEVLVGQPVQFSSAGSFDPDEGPQPLTLTWDFGDGTGDTGPAPIHAYADEGAYTVTLTVSDGQANVLVGVDVVVLPPPTPARPSTSGPLGLGSDGTTLWVVGRDAGTISRVDLASGEVTERTACNQPRAVALRPSAPFEPLVTCTGEDLVLRLPPGPGRIQRLPVGHMPVGIALTPDGTRAVVANGGDGTVSVLDLEDWTELARIPVGGEPHAVAIRSDGQRAYVSLFLTREDTGTVIVLALDQFPPALADTWTLAEDPSPDTSSSGGGFPNLLRALAIDPSGKTLWVGALKSNTGRGLWVSGEPLAPRNRVRGLFAPLALGDGSDLIARRIDTNDADAVSAIAFSPLGRYAYLLHPGAGTMSVYDLPMAALTAGGGGNGATVPFVARIDLCHVPHGIAVSPDGSRAFVACDLDRSVLEIDVTDPMAPQVVRTFSVTAEILPANILNGKRLFHRSRAPRHSDQNYIACASCHPDGGHDGRTWDFTDAGEGLRNTIDLRGHGGTAHGPVHWSANFDEIQDFENDIVFAFGGEGLAGDGAPPHPPLGAVPNGGRSQDLDDLAAYVASLGTPPPSPYRTEDGALGTSAVRGRALFFDPDRACTQCHVPPRFTDSTLTPAPADFVLHDVGTLTPASGKRLGGPLAGLDTPSLLGVWASAPYLHDGSAATLRDVLTRDTGDRHGRTSDLTDDEIDDLVAYLLALDGSDDEVPPDWQPPGGATTGDGGTTGDTTGASTGLGPTGSSTGTGSRGANTTEGGCACTVRIPSTRPTGAFFLFFGLTGRFLRRRTPCP